MSLPLSTASLYCLFIFIRLFWNHVFIWQSVRFNSSARIIRSVWLRYRFSWKESSSTCIWSGENEVRGFFASFTDDEYKPIPRMLKEHQFHKNYQLWRKAFLKVALRSSYPHSYVCVCFLVKQIKENFFYH